jgi:lysophospholipase L1-like esterase
MRPSPSPSRFAVAFAVAVAFPVAVASAADRVIPPSAGPAIFAALGAASPTFSLVSARIDRDAVWASLCRAGDPTQCFALRLSDPSKGCAAPATGPWCATLAEGAPDEETRKKLWTALAALKEDEIWKPSDPPHEAPGGSDHRPSTAHPWALAAALLFAPLLAAAALGRALRSPLARIHRAARAAIALTPLLAALAAATSVDRLGAWDLLTIGLALSLGLLLGSTAGPLRTSVRKASLALAATALSLALLEIITRLLPAPAATFPPPEEARLILSLPPAAEACAPMYPDRWPDPFLERTRAVRANAPVTLHVGDSMVEGVGVSPEQAFPALLADRDPSSNHVNAGFASRSIDAELLLVRAWTKRLPVAKVVLYVFGYNDLAELDRAYPCCPGGPLLDASPEANARCPEPGLPSGLFARLAASPAPYPVRVATARSALARRIATALAVAGNRAGAPADDADPGARWDRFAAILRALQRELDAKKIPFIVVYLPARASLEDPSPKSTGDHTLRGRVLDLAASIGATAIDPWEILEDAVRRDGAARVYLPPPDIHLTPEGHHLLASFLAPRLR